MNCAKIAHFCSTRNSIMEARLPTNTAVYFGWVELIAVIRSERTDNHSLYVTQSYWVGASKRVRERANQPSSHTNIRRHTPLFCDSGFTPTHATHDNQKRPIDCWLAWPSLMMMPCLHLAASVYVCSLGLLDLFAFQRHIEIQSSCRFFP